MNKDIAVERLSLYEFIDSARDGEPVDSSIAGDLRHVQRRRERRASSQKRAVNTGKPWTEEDDEVVMEPMLTNKERAELLGRSLSSVDSRRQTLKWGAR